MAARRTNPYLVKLHRSYTAAELAMRLGVHKNSVRNWQRLGLAAMDKSRPSLFHGATVRAFLIKRNADRKRPCPPRTFYCLSCRHPQPPAIGSVVYVELKPGTGNLRALCEVCQTSMNRRVRRSAIAAVMPGIDVQFAGACSRLNECSATSLNCDSEGEGATR
jgi:transcription elongation factor Elf1